MKLQLISIGKANEKIFASGIEEFCKRINWYQKFELKIIASKAKTTAPIDQQLNIEAEQILQCITADDIVVILDDKGKSLTTIAFSNQLQHWLNTSSKQIIFIIGGAYGIGANVKNRANFSLSLSAFTFPHQLVRLIFTEQLYRAFSVLHNEKYHHE
jgi:23S rRNA (pseudouridine1915-N3)-methyltransferase